MTNTVKKIEPGTKVATVDPMAMVQLAVEQNADVDKLSKLMDLQERWEANEARKAFLDAFARFQSEVPRISKTKAGHNYKYAPLSDIAEQIRLTLEDCGLSYRFDIQDTGEIISVTCIVSHRLGHQERTTMTGAPDTSGSKNSIQSRGSTVSYLQRYSLIGALGLTTADEDMDARLHTDTISEEQAASIKARLEATESDVARFCRALGITDVDAMPATKYAQADRLLSQKESANASG
jgi:hypothetical protein